MFKRLPIITLLLSLLSATVCLTATANGERDRNGFYQSLSEQKMGKLFKAGETSMAKGNKADALVYYTAVADRYEDGLSMEDKRLCAASLINLGEIDYADQQLSAAMNHYIAGLRISERNALTTETCKIYIGIGNLYSSQSDYEMGLRFYQKALQLAKHERNTTLQNKALNNLVGASCFAGHAKEGKKYYQMLARNREKSTAYHYNLLMGQGLIAASEGKANTAIKCYEQALAYTKKNKLTGGYEEATHSCLAQLYDDNAMPEKALAHLEQNEERARATNQYDLLAETLKHKASIYERQGRSNNALACKLEYVKLTDSIFNRKEFNTMKNAQFLYETNKSEKAINSLTEENHNRERLIIMQRWWMLTLTLGAIVFAAMLLIVYRQKRQLRQTYNELFDRSQTLLIENERMHPDSGSKPQDNTASILSREQRKGLLESIRKTMERTEIFCQPDFTIDKLSNIIGSNSRYVSEAINEEFGKNFRTFLNEYRIKEAMKRLSDVEHYGNFTIKAVSESVGYKSQANFITVFTKITGMKPSIYQKISQERCHTSI